jgi:tetraacyldisaccharide 4'-kinase
MSENAMRPLLLPLSYLYGAGVILRNWFFDAGVLQSQAVGVPVISVGNLSAGGVGKTPFVELLVKKLAHKKRKIAVVSRGYGRATSGTLVVSNGSVRCAEASDAGDEPAQLAAKYHDCVVIVDEQRVRGAKYAVEKFGADVIVLDDGFQHRYIRRDADIVIVPAAEAVRPEWMLPAGNRREPWNSLHRATMVAISRCESEAEYEEALNALRRWTTAPAVALSTKVSAFRRASTRFSVDLGGLRGKSVVAFSGIGNPLSFEKMLRSLGVNLKKHIAFPDHHAYSVSELTGLESEARDLEADFLVTTEKDCARLDPAREQYRSFVERTSLYFVEIEQSVIRGDSILNEMLDQL